MTESVIKRALYRFWPAARYTYLMVRLLQPFVGKPARVRHTEGRLLRKNWIYLRQLVGGRVPGAKSRRLAAGSPWPNAASESHAAAS